MTTTNMMTPIEDLFKYYADTKDENFLKETSQLLLDMLMKSEVEALIGAQKYQRTESRSNYLNGTRKRPYASRLGELQLSIPKLRTGSYFPSFLTPRRMWEKAIVNVVQEAYVHGVSTRKVDELVQALGLDGIDKSAVSRMSKELDEHVQNFLKRSFDKKFPYLWLDATFTKVREGGHVNNMALIIAVGVNEEGQREILGFDIGMTESGPFWKEFLRDLVNRGLSGVELVISDAHEGLKGAISECLNGCAWQRCRVHFMRNILSQIPRKQQGMVSAIVRTIFAAPDKKAAKQQLNDVVSQFSVKFPKAMQILENGCEDVLQYMSYPENHWRQIHSTNPLERLNREIRRRTNVVSIFPDRKSVIRLVGSLLIEQHEEWQISRRYFSKESMAWVTKQDDIVYALASTSVLHK